MRTILPFFGILLFLSSYAQGQSEIFLTVNHFFGDQPYESNSPTAVEAGYEMKVTRLEYYLSDFVITHDGGAETSLDGVHVLVNADESTTVSLGTWEIYSVENISFAVGVHPDYNHLDPASYDPGHPLAPQLPSMHWGWAAGYRFVAFEGKSGPNLTTTFEIHALGDSNFMTQSHDMSAESISGLLNIYIDADYLQMVNELDVSTGLIEHSESDEAVDLLLNMRSLVFSAGAPVGISETESKTFNLFPNPAQTQITIQPNEDWNIFQMEIFQADGKLIQRSSSLNGIQVLDCADLESGLYLVRLTNETGKTQSQQLLIQ